MGQFEGKVALVTGGSSGIGRAAAVKFAQDGAKVVIAARRVSEGEETVEMIREAGGDAVFVSTDATREADAAAMVKGTIAAFGRLDYAFNNAGVGGGGQLHEFAEESWDSTMDINLKGVWLSMKYEIAHMLQNGGGAIVNDASKAGLTGFAPSPQYSASKHGVVGLTKSAALMYAKQGIRINAVCPGWTRTPMLDRAFIRRPDLKTTAVEATPLGRFGLPEEIAEAVVWLCSDASSFITGVALPVDGGAFAGSYA